MIETSGFAASPSRLERNVAPANAPMKPGAARMPTVRQSTLPNLACETPETSEVPISEKWTAAEAAAGAMPTASRIVVEVTPYAIPSDPSTSWARRPTTATTMIFRMRAAPFRNGPDHRRSAPKSIG